MERFNKDRDALVERIRAKGLEINKENIAEVFSPDVHWMNTNHSPWSTYNFHGWWGKYLRYFFTIYDKDLAYRVFTIDYRRMEGGPPGMFIAAASLIHQELQDGYSVGVGYFYEAGGVEVIVHKRPG